MSYHETLFCDELKKEFARAHPNATLRIRYDDDGVTTRASMRYTYGALEFMKSDGYVPTSLDTGLTLFKDVATHLFVNDDGGIACVTIRDDDVRRFIQCSYTRTAVTEDDRRRCADYLVQAQERQRRSVERIQREEEQQRNARLNGETLFSARLTRD